MVAAFAPVIGSMPLRFPPESVRAAKLPAMDYKTALRTSNQRGFRHPDSQVCKLPAFLGSYVSHYSIETSYPSACDPSYPR